jgi:uncharacterized protein YcbK (DUF882 family)
MAKYFKDSEFACKCGCGFCEPDKRLLDILDIIRETLGVPVIVNSGCRCDLHNFNVGGVSVKKSGHIKGKKGGPKDSTHTRGESADIRAKGMLSTDLWKIIKKLYDGGKIPHLSGLGLYVKKNFCHVDVGPLNKNGKLREWKE